MVSDGSASPIETAFLGIFRRTDMLRTATVGQVMLHSWPKMLNGTSRKIKPTRPVGFLFCAPSTLNSSRSLKLVSRISKAGILR